MEMNKAMKMFVKNEVAFASAKWIHQAMSVFQIEHKEKTIHYFLDELNEGIADERVHYIQIALLRYKTLQKKPFYQIQTFGSAFYLASPLSEKELKWDWLYEPYYAFCEEIKVSSKKYVMQISAENLAKLCLLELEETKEIIRCLFRESLFHILTGEVFQQAVKQREISIHLSDYRGEYEPLLVLNNQTKETGEWLNGIFQNHAGNK